MLNFKHPFKHVSIEDVKKEIKALDEKYEGQYEFANSEEDYSLLVDVKNLLDNMKANEVDPSTMVEIVNDEDECEEISFQTWLYDYSGMEYLKSDNSYNWSSPLSHDINFEVWGYSESEPLYVVVRVHRMGDIRGNYTDEIILSYENYDDFLYSTMEDVSEYVGLEFEYNGEKYHATITIDWYKECPDVSIMNENCDEEILDLYDVYIGEDTKEGIIEKLQELMADNL